MNNNDTSTRSMEERPVEMLPGLSATMEVAGLDAVPINEVHDRVIMGFSRED